MSTKTYDPNKVIATVNGVPIKGFEESSMIKISPKEDKYTAHTGVDGIDTTFSKSHNKQGTISFTLMLNSLSTVALDALVKLSDLTFTPLKINILDINTGASVFADAFHQKQVELNFDKDPTKVEYSFICAELG